MKEWINDLIDEYPTKRTDTAIARLVRVFKDVPETIMRQAVDDYLLKEQFFPRVSDLRPYVEEAQEAARGQIQYGSIENQDRRKYTDDEILLHEIQHGTIPLTDLVEPNYDCDETGRVIPETIMTTEEWIKADPERQEAIAIGRKKIAALYREQEA